ncbi:MAG: AsnC/Lrp family transcriptional regulator [archaeon GW2011_AR3]|nr:MAG: AsnC/Lrp family transcriptional regulator [archaeon GW2011_AR3]MBS3109024.1 Lrp/AsnC family transcriptional regulator [Candidatus Woesearchaeota archaeon]
MAEYKLDLFDKKILYEVDKKSNISLAELSHKLKRSKQFILYRMKKLEQENIITGYHAIIDMARLGYFTFRVYFKFQQMAKKQGDEFVSHVENNLSQVWTITSMHGKWDFALFLGVKNILEFHTIWDNIMLKYKKNIKLYNVAVYAPIYNFNRKFFLDTHEHSIERVYGGGQREDVDELDWRIIQKYANDVRQSSLEIAKSLKISPDTVRSRIRLLEKKKVIVGYKIGLNLEKLGYVSYRVDLQLLSTARNAELFEYCKNHRNIYQINKSIGGADFETEVIVRDLNHLLEVIDDIKSKFPDVVNDVDYFGFSTFHILKYIPD